MVHYFFASTLDDTPRPAPQSRENNVLLNEYEFEIDRNFEFEDALFMHFGTFCM